jgi:hypothetical protein
VVFWKIQIKSSRAADFTTTVRRYESSIARSGLNMPRPGNIAPRTWDDEVKYMDADRRVKVTRTDAEWKNGAERGAVSEHDDSS